MTPAQTPPVAESVEPVQLVEDKARELLAHEYSMRGQPSVALLIRSTKSLNPDGPYAAAVAAIAASYEAGCAEGVLEAAEVADQIARFAKHKGLCAVVGGYGYCDCGRDAAVESLRALSKEPTK